MQGRLALALGLILLMAGGAAAQVRSGLSPDGRGLRLYPGERVVVRVGPGGVLDLVEARAAAPADAAPPRPGTRAPDAPLIDTPAGTVALLLGVQGGQSFLKVESGLSLAFDYRASLRRGEVDEPTSVCTVLPLLAGYELWPYAIGSMTLSGFATRTTNEVVCPQPPKPETPVPWPSTPKPASS